MVKKILFVGMYPNGVDKYLNAFFQNLIFAMADNGVECTVISPVSVTKYRTKLSSIPHESVDKTKTGATVKVYYPRYVSLSAFKIGSFNTRKIGERNFQKCAVRKAKALKQKFDLVYGHFVLDGGLAAIKIGRALELPSFFAYGECDFESQVRAYCGEPSVKDTAGLSGIISVSRKNTQELHEVKAFDNIPIITIPNATDSALFFKKDRIEARRLLNWSKDAFVVGFVGYFIHRKGDKRLLEAVSSLKDVYVAFAGKGEEPPKGDKVIFCRGLEHDDIPDFLNAIDIFVLPTLSEGSCNAIAEAMACGIPVVSSNLPFNDDVLDDTNSIRIDPMSVDEIRAAIERLHSDVEFRSKLAAASLETAKKLEIHQRADKIVEFLYSNIK